MAISNKLIISLLAVAAVGTVNSNIQAGMLEATEPKVNPTTTEQSVFVDINLGHDGETGDISVASAADVAVDEMTSQTTCAITPAEERAAAVMADEEDEIEVIIPETEDVTIETEVVTSGENVATEVVVPSDTVVVVEEQTTEAAPATPVETEAVAPVVPVATQAPVQETEPAPVVVETVVETVPTPAPVAINYPPQGTMEYELFILVNNAREANGLAPYSYRGDLASAASVRAGEATIVFDHLRPDGSEYYTVNSSIVYGENLAVGFTSAQEAFNCWMNSPTHRANILDSDYTACGFAYTVGADGNWYWAQEFGYID